MRKPEIWSWWAQETQGTAGFCGFVLFLNVDSWAYGKSRQWFYFIFSNVKAICKFCGLLLWGYINLCGKINTKLITKVACQWGKFFECKDLFTYHIISSAEKETVLSNIATVVLSSHQTLTLVHLFQHQEISWSSLVSQKTGFWQGQLFWKSFPWLTKLTLLL